MGYSKKYGNHIGRPIRRRSEQNDVSAAYSSSKRNAYTNESELNYKNGFEKIKISIDLSASQTK